MAEKKKNLDPLRNDLEQFLSLKYQFSGINLEQQIEDDVWKGKFQNWTEIRSLLTYKERPVYKSLNGTYTNCYDKITVILSKRDDNHELNFELLKGAAYYPFQLEPEPQQEFAYDEDCLIQLAYATYYRYWIARAMLSRLDRKYTSMSAHKICLQKDVPTRNEDDLYYEFPVPKQFINKSGLLSQKEFIEPEKTIVFFDYLLGIAQNKTRPLKKNYKEV